MKIIVALTVAILANSVGNLCLDKGMKQYPDRTLDFVWVVKAGFHAVSNPWMIAGVALLVIFLAAYLTALSWADLSFVLPATAPVYLVNAGLSKVFLHEQIPATRWAGTILIVTGTWLVARTYTASPTSRPSPEEGERRQVAAGVLQEAPVNATAGSAGAGISSGSKS